MIVDKQLTRPLNKMCDPIRIGTCARQDIALRGHHEHPDAAEADSVNRGNFLELTDLVKLESPSTKAMLDRLPSNTTYSSSKSQNELLQSAAGVVTEKIMLSVKSSGRP